MEIELIVFDQKFQKIKKLFTLVTRVNISSNILQSNPNPIKNLSDFPRENSDFKTKKLAQMANDFYLTSNI